MFRQEPGAGGNRTHHKSDICSFSDCYPYALGHIGQWARCVKGVPPMIDEQGPAGRLPEDEAPTEIFGPIRTRERRTVKLTATLAAAILIVLAVAGYEVATRLGHSSTPAASRPAVAVTSRPAATSVAAATQPPSPSASPSATS